MSADLQSYFEAEFEKLEKELAEQAEAQERHAVLEQSIARRTQKIAQIALTCEDDLSPQSAAARLVRGLREGGLSNAIRNILKATKEPLGATDIHRELKAIGYPMPHQNILATIHLTLKRLNEQGHILPANVGSKKAFVWNPTEPKPRWAQYLHEMRDYRKPSTEMKEKK